MFLLPAFDPGRRRAADRLLAPRPAPPSGSLIPSNRGVSCHSHRSLSAQAGARVFSRSGERRASGGQAQGRRLVLDPRRHGGQVGGDRVDVVTLVGPDGDSPVFSRRRPTPRTLAVVAACCSSTDSPSKAGWTRLEKSSGFNGKTDRRLDRRQAAHHGRRGRRHARDHHDPHAWQDLGNGKLFVINIRDGSPVGLDGKAVYEGECQRNISKRSCSGGRRGEGRAGRSCPRTGRKIITSHDAFGYFGAAYGLEVIAPEGVSTESEASAQDVAKIIRQIKAEHHPGGVHGEHHRSPPARPFRAETDAKIGGELYTEAAARGPDGPAPTYLDMFRHNVGALTEALSS